MSGEYTFKIVTTSDWVHSVKPTSSWIHKYIWVMATGTQITFDEHTLISEFCSGFALQWRHNEHDGVSNHSRCDCLLDCLFCRRSKITPKLHVTNLCVGNSLVTGEFHAKKAGNAEHVSISWSNHGWLCIRMSAFGFSLWSWIWVYCGKIVLKTDALWIWHHRENSVSFTPMIIQIPHLVCTIYLESSLFDPVTAAMTLA